jgi:nucleotide-binding universal stress UspA family protein
VLVAVDVSPAAAPTIAAAERFANVFGAALRVLTVVQPIPPLVEDSTFDAAAHLAAWEDAVRREVWPLIRSEGAQPVLRHGPVVDTIAREAAAWPADLLVVGSHGKGWVDRLLLGTITESLLNRLPTSLLVVPAPRTVEAATPPPARGAAALV